MQDAVALGLNQVGRGAGRAATLAVSGLAVWRFGRRRTDLAAFAVTQMATPAVVNAVKLVARHERPGDARIEAWGSSFPSGHAAFAAATGASLALAVAPPTGQGRLAAWTGAAALASGMAWSRVHLRVHRPLDVAVGALIGAGVAATSFAVAGRRGQS